MQKLTDGQKKVALERAKKLLRFRESGQLSNLVFSDAKPFQIEQFVNKQSNRVYLPKRSAENLHLRLVTRTQALPIVTTDGSSPLVFIDRGVKRRVEYYRKYVLETVLKPCTHKDFSRAMDIPTGFNKSALCTRQQRTA